MPGGVLAYRASLHGTALRAKLGRPVTCVAGKLSVGRARELALGFERPLELRDVFGVGNPGPRSDGGGLPRGCRRADGNRLAVGRGPGHVQGVAGRIRGAGDAAPGSASARRVSARRCVSGSKPGVFRLAIRLASFRQARPRAWMCWMTWAVRSAAAPGSRSSSRVRLCALAVATASGSVRSSSSMAASVTSGAAPPRSLCRIHWTGPMRWTSSASWTGIASCFAYLVPTALLTS